MRQGGSCTRPETRASEQKPTGGWHAITGSCPLWQTGFAIGRRARTIPAAMRRALRPGSRPRGQPPRGRLVDLDLIGTFTETFLHPLMVLPRVV